MEDDLRDIRWRELLLFGAIAVAALCVGSLIAIPMFWHAIQLWLKTPDVSVMSGYGEYLR